jgi:hypothetical protein
MTDHRREKTYHPYGMEAFKGGVRLQTSRSLRDWVNAAMIPIDPNIFTYLSHDPVNIRQPSCSVWDHVDAMHLPKFR